MVPLCLSGGWQGGDLQGALVGRLSGALLMGAGAYVAWYGVFELRVLAGGSTADPVVAAAIGVQEALSRTVAGIDPAALALVGGTLVALTAGLALVRHRRAAHPQERRPFVRRGSALESAATKPARACGNLTRLRFRIAQRCA